MMRAKKALGQHFLHDENIARKIAEAFLLGSPPGVMLEIGPGTGALTKYLVSARDKLYYGVEADERMIGHLLELYPQLQARLFHADILEFDLSQLGSSDISVVGNFPYNISSQILFKVYEERQRIPFLTGMFQKEVAQRIASIHGNKEYGILSVFIQAFYQATYLFEVHEKCFSPPPKVKSAVIQLLRKKNSPQLVNESFFRAVVKAGFNQRRKTLRNSLSGLITPKASAVNSLFTLRAEQLSVEDWISLANEFAKASE